MTMPTYDSRPGEKSPGGGLELLSELYELGYSKPREVKFREVSNLLGPKDRFLSISGGAGGSLITPMYAGYEGSKVSRSLHSLPERLIRAMELNRPLLEVAVKRSRSDRARVGITLRAFPNPNSELIAAAGGKAYGIVSSWSLAGEELDRLEPTTAEEMIEGVIGVGSRLGLDPTKMNSGLAEVNLEGDRNSSFRIALSCDPGAVANRIMAIWNNGGFEFDEPQDLIERVTATHQDS